MEKKEKSNGKNVFLTFLIMFMVVFLTTTSLKILANSDTPDDEIFSKLMLKTVLIFTIIFSGIGVYRTLQECDED